MPLAVSTLITVAAFLPIYLLPGGTGEFVRAIPVGVSICLLVALFVCGHGRAQPVHVAAKETYRADDAPVERDKPHGRASSRVRNAWYHRFLVGIDGAARRRAAAGRAS